MSTQSATAIKSKPDTDPTKLGEYSAVQPLSGRTSVQESFAVNSVGEAEMLFAKARSGQEADLTVLVIEREGGRVLQSEQEVALHAR